MTQDLTEQQHNAVRLAVGGKNLAIEALAGTGKTTTLVKIAEAMPNKRGGYLAFNKAIQQEASQKFPSNVTCRTIHSMAIGSVKHTDPWVFDRLRTSRRLKSVTIANVLNIKSFSIPRWNKKGSRVLSAGKVAGLTMRLLKNYCRSSDKAILPSHMPNSSGLDAPGEFWISKKVARHIVPFAEHAWRDLTKSEGDLRFEHYIYLKMWQLQQPKLPFDFLLVDEAQDLNPVMCSILSNQSHCQVIAVGDSRQQIYEWNGAVNALDKFKGEKAYLTKSFRFGPEVAQVANYVLEKLNETISVEGVGAPSLVAHSDNPDAVLCRSNWGTLLQVLLAREADKSIHLIGRGTEILHFAKACLKLQNGTPNDHPELACFDSWNELLEFVREDELGGDLSSMVRLVEKVGPLEVINAIESCTASADHADIVISTAHKSKGLEWPVVCLCEDMIQLEEPHESLTPDSPQLKMSEPELKLLYVAISRAKQQLDISNLKPLAERFCDSFGAKKDVVLTQAVGVVKEIPNLAEETQHSRQNEPESLENQANERIDSRAFEIETKIRNMKLATPNSSFQENSAPARMRKTHRRAYEPWRSEENDWLLELHTSGYSNLELSRIFERQKGAIESRIRKAGGIPKPPIQDPSDSKKSSINPSRHYCPWCGKETEVPWNFCRSCGEELPS